MEFVVQGGTQFGEVNLKRFSPTRRDSYGKRLLRKIFRILLQILLYGLQILEVCVRAYVCAFKNTTEASLYKKPIGQ